MRLKSCHLVCQTSFVRLCEWQTVAENGAIEVMALSVSVYHDQADSSKAPHYLERSLLIGRFHAIPGPLGGHSCTPRTRPMVD